MVSQRVLTKECVCCQLPLLTDTEHNAGEWKLFVRYTIIIIALDWLIDWIEFDALSALFQPCNGIARLEVRFKQH